MANISDLPAKLMDLTKSKETLLHISKLPMEYENKLSLFFQWAGAVNHNVTGLELRMLQESSTKIYDGTQP